MSSRNCKQFRTFPCQASKLVSDLSLVLDRAIPRDRYLLDSILSKYTGVGSVPTEELEQRAYKKLLEAESRNVKTRERLTGPGTTFGRWGFHSSHVLHVARTLISNVLGDFSYGCYEYSSFTSGSSVGYPRRIADVWYKYRGKISCTPNAVRRVLALVEMTPAWKESLTKRYGPNPFDWIDLVPGNTIFTVPKNAVIHRAAAKEPTGNMLLQNAIGFDIRQKLRSVGINLNDQSNNQRAARKASIDMKDATLDLADASNSVTSALCFVLLPPEWYHACVAARSPFGNIPGSETIHWEMMSSMGNGFTFELESLIFWALSEATRKCVGVPGCTLVYGDDIITPVACAHAVIAVLGFCGFRTNASKSFIRGNFRESCGVHYISGLDITPIYIRDPIDNTSRMIWFLNRLREWSGDTGICDPRVEALYFKLRSRFVDPVLWGGVRMNSVSSLVTPHAPRQRLKFLTSGRHIDGVAAVLRWFQSRVRQQENVNFTLRQQLEYLYDPSGPDIQTAYELYGTIPMSADMTRITREAATIAIEANKELPNGDTLPYFVREV